MKIAASSAFYMATVLLAATMPALAAPKYDAPQATFELVKETPALQAFTEKLSEMSNSNTEKDVTRYFSDDTEIFVVNPKDPQRKPVSIGRFDRSKPKFHEIARAVLTKEELARPNHLQLVKDYNQFLTLDSTYAPGTFPGFAGRVCWNPIIAIDDTALNVAIAQMKPQKVSAVVTVEALPVHAGPNDKKTRDKVVIETLRAKSGVILIDIVGNGEAWNGKVLTPLGKIGYVDQSKVIGLTPSAYCFAQQKNGEWLVDAVIK